MVDGLNRKVRRPCRGGRDTGHARARVLPEELAPGCESLRESGSRVVCAVHAARARHGTREGACSPRRMGAPRCLRLSNMPCHLHGFSLFKFEESLIWRARLRRVQYLISRKYLETTHSPRLLGAHCHEICFHFIRPPRNGFRGFGQYRADGRYPVRRDAAGHHADGCGLTGERSGRRHGGN